MKIRNFSEFSELLDKEFAWRKQELHLFKTRIPDSSYKSFQKPLIRGGITILYAHWEGFVKNAATYYLQFISSRSLRLAELKSQFIALSLSNQIKDLKVTELESKTKIIDFIVEEQAKTAKIPYKNIINTKSNLKFEVFADILFTINIDILGYKSKKNLIDDLVDLRNNIAHGEAKEVSWETYIGFYNDIIEVMENVKTDIENAALLEKYKKATTETLS